MSAQPSIVEETRRALGPVGVYGSAAAQLRDIAIERERQLVDIIDHLGYGSLWTGEALAGKDVFARLSVALAGSTRLAVGTGIANTWRRSPRTARAAAATLAEAYPGRFVLGLGIGHHRQAESAGEDFRPIDRMRAYLDDMDAPIGDHISAVPYPDARYARVLAAVGPRMLELSAERADGAHPFFQSVEHTARAREILGPEKLLIPHQGVLLTTDRNAGLARAAEIVRMIPLMPAYANGYRRLGFTDADLSGPSERLIDAAIVIGDEQAIAKRVGEQLDAGADHVLISPVNDTLDGFISDLERLAPVVL